MNGKVEDVIKDAKIAGAFARQTGPVLFLSICVLILSVVVVVNILTMRATASYVTRAELKDYTSRHELEVQLRDQRLMRENAEAVQVLSQKLMEIEDKVDDIYTYGEVIRKNQDALLKKVEDGKRR